MGNSDQRPTVGVAHGVLHTDRMAQTSSTQSDDIHSSGGDPTLPTGFDVGPAPGSRYRTGCQRQKRRSRTTGGDLFSHTGSKKTMYPYSNMKPATSWNKGMIIGQKPPLKVREIWALRVRLQLAHRTRELALFNLAIDSKLRGCALVRLRACDVQRGTQLAQRAIVMQSKTQRLVQFELSDQTREAVSAWIAEAGLSVDQFLFPSRLTCSPHISIRQYAS